MKSEIRTCHHQFGALQGSALRPPNPDALCRSFATGTGQVSGSVKSAVTSKAEEKSKKWHLHLDGPLCGDGANQGTRADGDDFGPGMAAIVPRRASMI